MDSLFFCLPPPTQYDNTLMMCDTVSLRWFGLMGHDEYVSATWWDETGQDAWRETLCLSRDLTWWDLRRPNDRTGQDRTPQYVVWYNAIRYVTIQHDTTWLYRTWPDCDITGCDRWREVTWADAPGQDRIGNMTWCGTLCSTYPPCYDVSTTWWDMKTHFYLDWFYLKYFTQQ